MEGTGTKQQLQTVMKLEMNQTFLSAIYSHQEETLVMNDTDISKSLFMLCFAGSRREKELKEKHLPLQYHFFKFSFVLKYR